MKVTRFTSHVVRTPADNPLVVGLPARNDTREVVLDPHARYFGAELAERSLVPAGDARLGEIRFRDWLTRTAIQR